MQKATFALACLACGCRGWLSRPQPHQVSTLKSLTSLLLSDGSIGFYAVPSPLHAARVSQGRLLQANMRYDDDDDWLSDRDRKKKERQEKREPTEKEVQIATAALTATFSVAALSGGVVAAAVFGLMGAYSTTLDNQLGDAARKAGTQTIKAYTTTVEIAERYEVGEKLMNAVDSGVIALERLDRNLGLTEGIDGFLGISKSLESLGDSFKKAQEAVDAKKKDDSNLTQKKNTRKSSPTMGSRELHSRGGDLKMMADEDDNTATSATSASVGAAVLGGALGVQFTGDLLSAVLLALVAAYASTLDNGLGNVAKSAGGFATNAYDKTLEINDQFDILPKAKGAADATLTVADNINRNYGITEKLDEKLKISGVISKAQERLDDLSGKVDKQVEELKKSASSPE